MKYCIFACLALFPFSSVILGLEPDDSQMIHQAIDHFTDCWNLYEWQGISQYYAENADFVNVLGNAYNGKEEIERRHVKLNETKLQGSQFEVINTKLREVQSGLVIAHVHWKISACVHDQKRAYFPEGMFTHVFLKNENQWEIIATQNTEIASARELPKKQKVPRRRPLI